MKSSAIFKNLGKQKITIVFVSLTVILGVLSASFTPKTYASQSKVLIRLNNMSLGQQDNKGNARIRAAELAAIEGDTMFKTQTYVSLMFFSDIVPRTISQKMGYKVKPFKDYDLKITAKNFWVFSAYGRDPETSAKLANVLVNELIALVNKYEKLNYGRNYVASFGTVKAQPGEPPKRPIVPVPIRNLILALILGLLLRLLFERYRQNFQKYVRRVEDIMALTSLPYLGTLPRRENGRTEIDVVPDNVMYVERNAINHIRTSLVFGSFGAGNQSVLLVSDAPGRGTSFVSNELAESIVQIGKTVCLVHCNLRHADYLKQLKKSPNYDFSPYVLQEKELNSNDFELNSENVVHFYASDWNDSPSEFLLSLEFKNFVKDLKSVFNYVIVDGPPILSVSDSAIIGSVVDTTIFVVRFDCSTKTDLRNSLQGLTGVGVHPRGFILNDVPYGELDLTGKHESNDLAAMVNQNGATYGS